jgi:hypothetical protein
MRQASVVVAWRGGRGEAHVRGAAPAPWCEATRVLTSPERFGTSLTDLPESHLLGACTAACLAAAALFALALGGIPTPTALNLLERSSNENASPATLGGPVDVGDVQVVGAGAVAHALSYWVREFGHQGRWEFVDADLAELHNTNRCLGMTAAAAGWPDGLPVGRPEGKARSAARLIGATPVLKWFHELPDSRARRDLLLVLANEFDVRAHVAALGEPLLLHATTSPNWTAELHRHRAGVDDCPASRIPPSTKAALACSTGPAVPEDAGSGDAALPFLSAASGLLLVTALLDLADDQHLMSGRFNHWPLNLSLVGLPWSRHQHPGVRCPHQLPPSVRTSLHSGDPRRWDWLDTERCPSREEEAPPIGHQAST